MIKDRRVSIHVSLKDWRGPGAEALLTCSRTDVSVPMLLTANCDTDDRLKSFMLINLCKTSSAEVAMAS